MTDLNSEVKETFSSQDEGGKSFAVSLSSHYSKMTCQGALRGSSQNSHMATNGSDVTSWEQMGIGISVVTDMLHSMCCKKIKQKIKKKVSTCVEEPTSPSLPLSPPEK